MSGLVEEQLMIQAETGGLQGMLYVPSGRPRGTVLFCNPLFEERKSSVRVMADCARALCGAGLAVLRFDYRGCGDSAGEFEEFGPADWESDIRAAARFLTERGAGRFGMLGLRLGANLALHAAAAGLSVDFMVLWEPVTDANGYIEHELRRKLLREMVTFGKGRTSKTSLAGALESGQSVDLDGYLVTPAFYKAVKEMSFQTRALPAHALVVNITHDGRPSGGMAGIGAALADGGRSFEVITGEPFWNRVGLAECGCLVDRTLEWTGRCLADER